MDKLISEQAAIDIVEFECGEWSGLAKTIVKAIEQLPPTQPEIIRCKDCVHYYGEPGNPNIICFQMHEDDFCSYGERREE